MPDDSLEHLTDAERAYFESAGEKTDGLTGPDGGAAEAKPDAVGDQPAVTEPTQPTEDGAAKSDEQETAPKDKDPPLAAEAESAASKDETEADDDTTQQRKGPIPWQKYAREQKKNAEKIAALETQLAQANERFTRGDERLKLLAEAMRPDDEANKKEDLEPNPEEDIYAWIEWQRREMARLRTGADQTASHSQRIDHERELTDAYQRDAATFLQSTPDFGQAYQALLASRGMQLQILGHPPGEIQKILRSEELSLVEHALRNRESPSAYIYELAKANGYRPAVNGEVRRGDTVDHEVRAKPTEQKPSAAEEVERIAAAQAAGKTLSGSGGSASELSVEALSNMSDAEFEALYRSKKSQIESLMGRG